MAEKSKNVIVPKNVTDALRQIFYPGSKQDIVSLDMVQEIRIADNKISFTLVFQRSDDPNQGKVVKECEDILLKELGDIDIKGNISVKSIHQMERPVLPGVKNIIAVASGKGGVGKSTVALNLAVALSKTGAKVGLIDADIYGPSIPKMVGAEDARPYSENVNGREMLVPVERFGLKILSIGFFIKEEDALVWRGPMASNALKQLITESNWGDLDYLLIDLPPGTSDIHLTLVQTVPVTAAIVVTTPQAVALSDVIRGTNMFKNKTVDVPVLGMVENMAWFTPKELPNNKYYIFGKDGGKKLSEKMNLPLLGQIPIVQSICESGDNGVPIAVDENSIVGKEFMALAKATIKGIQERNERYKPTHKVEIKHKK